MVKLDNRLELLLSCSELSEEQIQALRDTWVSIKSKGHAESLSTQQAVFSYGLAVAYGGTLQKIDVLCEKLEIIQNTTPKTTSQKNSPEELKAAVNQGIEESKLKSMIEATFNEVVKVKRGSYLVKLFFLIIGAIIGIILQKYIPLPI